jgi:glycolate oxidase FAD binding subunit
VVEAPVFGAQLPNLDLMQRIKQEFDPEHLLNPGRFVV